MTKSAKEILLANLHLIQPKFLQDAVEKIISEVDLQEEKILSLEKIVRGKQKKIFELQKYFPIQNLPGEIWKDIEGYENIYQISNKGRVKSFHGNKVKILKPIKNQCGYYDVHLSKSNRAKSLLIHRLVAITFIPNPENKSAVNHKDGNKVNNCVENLEWVTPKENVVHAWKLGLNTKRCGVEHKNAKLTEKQVKFVRENYIPRDKEFGGVALAKKFGVCDTVINKIIHKKTYRSV